MRVNSPPQSPEPDAVLPAPTAERPKWYLFAFFLGRPPPLTRSQWSTLGLVAIVSLFEQYDIYLFSLNLKQIQADLGIAEEDLGFFGAVVRSGALFAIPITLAADRFGRKRMLLITVVAYTLLTGATAFAPTMEAFVALQFLARAFAIAETLIAVVVIVEEFPPEHRGWGIGALGAIQATGAGLAAASFGLVELLPNGWRDLYLVGFGPLLLIAYLRRNLPETARFEALVAARTQARLELTAASPRPSILPRLPTLSRTLSLRLTALMAAALGLGVTIAPAVFFAPKYLQDVHGWTPAGVAVLNVAGGVLGTIGNPLAGWLSDRRGRRPVASAFGAGVWVAALAFYTVAGSIAPAFWVLLIFTTMGSQVTVASFGAELFPTAQRSSASGLRAGSTELGAMLGLALVSVLLGVVGTTWNAILVASFGVLAVPVLVWTMFPETAGSRLESLDEASPVDEASDDDAPAPSDVGVANET